jgi:hypothetical protein
MKPFILKISKNSAFKKFDKETYLLNSIKFLSNKDLNFWINSFEINN